MIETLMIWSLLLILPWEVTATCEIDQDKVYQQVFQLEVDSRAYRQKITGRGL